MVPLDSLAARLRAWLGAHAGLLGLDASCLTIDYVLNWGGFVNASFRVADGRRTLHAKLATEPEARAGLRRWRAVHARLEARYHAPPLVAWIDLAEDGAEGMLFEHVAGESPDVIPMTVAAGMLAVLRTLHADDELASALGAASATHAGAFHATFGERFAADLADIEARRPPFVSSDTLAWMRGESEALGAIVRGSAAFAAPAISPVHGDVWASNLLVRPDSGWTLLDWDDLSLGDPAMDVAKLLAAASPRQDAADARRLLDVGAEAGAFGERLALYERAILLDWTIDPLADWLEAGTAPEHAEQVRAEKRRVHERSLARYRARWG